MKPIPQMEPSYDQAEQEAVQRYLAGGGWLTEFKKTEEFANAIASFTASPCCVITNNGTISLSLALMALNIGPGDEVLVPNLTMIATPNSVKLVGAQPILADIDAKTLCLSLSEAEKKITSKTKAVMYVAFNGRSQNMHEVADFAKKHKLLLIEDAAQALGAHSQGRHIGTFGIIGSFSFSVPKIITTGQGGALVTQERSLYEKIRRLKDFGRTEGGCDIHDTIGYNFKFTDLQAVIGIEQMKKLPQRITRKKEIYRLYQSRLEGIDAVEFIPTNLNEVPPWFIDIYVPDPDRLAATLKEYGIGTRRIYPPIHSQKSYQLEQSFPVTEKYAQRGLWLPSSIKLTDDEINFICDKIARFYKERH